MTKSFTNRARIAYYLAWLPMIALLTALLGLGGIDWWSAAILGLALGAPFALVCGSSYYMARALPLRRARWAQVLLNLLGASLVASALWSGVGYLVGKALGGPTGELLTEQVTLLFGVGLGFFAISLAFHYLILALEAIRSAERNADHARVLTREAELRALRAQIDPHFLFNSLNSIAALTTVEPARARRMCQLLSEFFRSTLTLGDRSRHPLGEELALARRYLDIELVRFEDRLTVNEDVDRDCLDVELPPLLMQPLVENAVKHGAAGMASAARIEIRVRGEGGRVLVSVINDRDQEAASTRRSGRGLAIVEERLRAFYGGAAGMMVRKDEASFEVELRLPAGGGTQGR
ncbi:MAG: histidine kinase [Deltaproteobacteria bacterium]|nr:histidine kinase [Deltaproteobacteria bacterium]